jgi:hypothetical protein
MDESDHARRTKQNVVVLFLLVVIVFAGTLLFRNFVTSIAIMKCVTSGRQDCVERVLVKPSQELRV